MILNDYLKKPGVTQKNLADKLGCTQAMVSKIVLGKCPAETVLNLSEVTEWQVTPHELRPDLYPYPQDGLPEHLREVA